MAAIKVLNMQGSEVGSMELNDNVFAVEYNEPLIHQAVVTRLANERQGTKSTLTRSPPPGFLISDPTTISAPTSDGSSLSTNSP